VRLDKYLKVSRIVKRRALAQQLCDWGHVTRNGRTAKPSTNVEVGDVLEINFGSRKLTVQVAALAESAGKKAAESLYIKLSDEMLNSREEIDPLH